LRSGPYFLFASQRKTLFHPLPGTALCQSTSLLSPLRAGCLNLSPLGSPRVLIHFPNVLNLAILCYWRAGLSSLTQYVFLTNTAFEFRRKVAFPGEMLWTTPAPLFFLLDLLVSPHQILWKKDPSPIERLHSSADSSLLRPNN